MGEILAWQSEPVVRLSSRGAQTPRDPTLVFSPLSEKTKPPSKPPPKEAIKQPLVQGGSSARPSGGEERLSPRITTNP